MGKCKIIKNLFKIHPFYYIISFIAAITGNFRGFAFFSLIIIVHECGHLFVSLLFRWNVDKVIILPFGAITLFNEDINRPLIEEFLILIFGPLFQIAFTYLYSCFHHDEVFIYYSRAILFFNLLPIYPLDGAKVVNIVLNKCLSFKMSHLITIYLSFFVMIIIIFKVSFNLIWILTLIFILIRQLEELRNHKNIFNKFLLERYTKKFHFKKNKVIKSLNVNKMKRDYNHIFYNGKRYITEKENLKKRFDFNRKTW